MKGYYDRHEQYHVDAEKGLQIHSQRDDALQHFRQVHEEEDTRSDDCCPSTVEFHFKTVLERDSEKEDGDEIAKNFLSVGRVAFCQFISG